MDADWEIALADLRAELTDRINDLEREVEDLRDRLEPA